VVDQAEPFTDEDYWTLWQNFQSFEDHSGYKSINEHNDRFDIFCKNMDKAREFNQEKTNTWTQGVTIFSDMTEDEFKAYASRGGLSKPSKLTSKRNLFVPTGDAPDSIDWTTQGAVTPIKNQGQCGSCWAFSTTGGIEGQNYMVNNKLSSFSEQELVDCSKQNSGCNGGLMDYAFQWVETNGLCFESAYTPYHATDGTCAESSCTAQVHVSGYTDITQGDTAALKEACGKHGPISIAVDATPWQQYTGGVFTPGTYFNRCAGQLDHGVLLVGYNTGSGYWKVKNSWGTSWGEDGYIRMQGTTQNTCLLANSASYPTVVASG
jgi:cathepsin L